MGFANETSDGHGCISFYLDNHQPTRKNSCFIKGIKLKANGAYLGGVVLTPFINNNKKN